MISVRVFQVLLGISIPFYLISFSLYSFRRNTFPIAQRKPELGIFELFLFGLIGIFEGIVSILEISNSNTFLTSCGWSAATFTCVFCFGMAMTSYRVCCVITKDFATKALLLESDSLGLNKNEQQKELFQKYSSNNPFFKMSYHFGGYLLKKTTIGVVSFVMILPAALIGVVNSIWMIARAAQTDKEIQSFSEECFHSAWRYAGRLIFAMFCYHFSTCILAIFTVIKMNDNFRIGTEFRMYLVLNLYICSVSMLAMWNIELFRVFVINDHIYHLLQVLVTFPMVYIIQCIFPLWLSFRNDALQKKNPNPNTSSEAAVQGEVKLSSLNSAQLEHIIIDSEGRELLLKFLESEFAVENLFFVEACDKFKKDLSSLLASDSVQEKKYGDSVEYIKKIKETFVSASAASSVNLSYRSREHLLATIDALLSNAGDEVQIKSSLKLDMFDKAREEIFRLLLKDSCSRFRLTQEFQQYARSKLEGRIQVSMDITNKASSV
jgi:hypothetical protein